MAPGPLPPSGSDIPLHLSWVERSLLQPCCCCQWVPLCTAQRATVRTLFGLKTRGYPVLWLRSKRVYKGVSDLQYVRLFFIYTWAPALSKWFGLFVPKWTTSLLIISYLWHLRYPSWQRKLRSVVRSSEGQGIILLPCRLPKVGGRVTEYALPWRRLSCHSMETFIP